MLETTPRLTKHYFLRIVVLEHVGLHVPNDLMGKQLGNLGGLNDKMLGITWNLSVLFN